MGLMLHSIGTKICQSKVEQEIRSNGAQPIRRSIENKEVPLPGSWNNFISLNKNKFDLARFLSQQLLKKCPERKTIVISGGGVNALEVTSNPGLDITALRASHKEADMRMMLHAINSQKDTVVLISSDTDVLLLLITHLHLMKSPSDQDEKYF